MPLHRDIHWLGKQWAVTGHGLQLINQKQMGYYDIEAARLWEARVSEVQSKAWIDRPDFDKALEIARGKFAQLAPDDLPPAAVAAPPPPVRVTPQAAPRAPLEAASVPSIEELLARLKSKSVAAVPSANPAEAPVSAPAKPQSPEPESAKPELSEPRSFKAESPKPEPLRVEAIKSELPKSEPPQPPRPELRQSAVLTPEVPAPEARKVASPKVEQPQATAKSEFAKPELAKPESAERTAPKPSSPKAEPVRSEAPESETPISEARRTAPVKKLEVPPLVPVVKVVRRPAWPVFARKIAGSGKFLQPWRVTSARWRGPSSGLPPRP